jgi:nitrite reductase/ring-hydroxylating ferredoxin subunit
VEYVFACRVGDVPRSECRVFTVSGRDVLICEYGGNYYAHSPFCSHLTYSLDYAPVCSGAIECTWHRFTYDVVTGTNVSPGVLCPTGDPALSKPIAPLSTYPVERRGDSIYVALS